MITQTAQASWTDWLGISTGQAETVKTLAPVGNSQTIGLQSFASRNSAAVVLADNSAVVSGGALLPDSGPVGTIADVTEEPVTDQISLYVVRSGDTFSAIAKMYGVSVNTIAWANDMSAKTVLKEGQVLVILPVSGIRHTVAKGETLASIAKKYKGDAEEIALFNGLEGAKLAVGQVIIIPNGEAANTPVPSGSKPAPVRGSGPSYAGYYMRPISGGTRTQGLHGYNAVDLASYMGAPIMAAADGRVILNRDGGWNGGYGNYIVIEHPNKTQTLYSHLSKNLVTVGQNVSQGQTIGLMGNTGKVVGATGVHLHFEIRGAKNPF